MDSVVTHDLIFPYLLRKVTEKAALASYNWIGSGNKIGGDSPAVEAMRASLEELKSVLQKRRDLYQIYQDKLDEFAECLFERPRVGVNFTPWLVTLNTKGRRLGLMKHLKEKNIESAQVHYRNDIYSIFKKYSKGPYANMDKIEDHYLVLPLHTKLSNDQIGRICNEVKSFLRTY